MVSGIYQRNRRDSFECRYGGVVGMRGSSERGWDIGFGEARMDFGNSFTWTVVYCTCIAIVPLFMSL